jgi:hypothetical protein
MDTVIVVSVIPDGAEANNHVVSVVTVKLTLGGELVTDSV